MSDDYRKYTFCSIFSSFCSHLTIASGSEHDLNYFELPIDVENSVNEIDGRPSGDGTVGVKLNENETETNSIMEGHLTISQIKELPSILLLSQESII